MFGASEDRARQLAGRQRWKRISSSGSHSNYRSVSSSSQASHWDTSSIFEQNIQRPSPIPEHYTHTVNGITGDQHSRGGMHHVLQSAVASDVEGVLSRMMAEDQFPRTQQQRNQAEHLSQVLYNDTTIDNVLPPSSHHYVLPSQTKQYGSLQSRATTLHQIRNSTAPVPRTHEGGPQLTSMSAYDLTDHSMSVGITQRHTIVSLRGGADDGLVHANKLPSGSVSTFSHEFPWILSAMAHACWYLPFNSGIMYKFFLDTLTPEQVKEFIRLFSKDSKCQENEFDSQRHEFYAKLDLDSQVNFKRVIIERAKELLGPNLDDTSCPLDELHRLQDTSGERDCRSYPLVRLPQLIDATLQLHPLLGGFVLPKGTGMATDLELITVTSG